MIDTGAVHTLVSQSVARILKLKVAPLRKYDHSVLIAANGSNLELIGSVALKLYINGLVIHQDAFVAKRLSPRLVLGVDFLSTHKATVSYRGDKGILSLFDDLITVPMHSLLDETNCVVIPRTTSIPAFTEAYITVNTPKRVNNTTILLEDVQRPTPIVVAKALTACKNNKTVCRVLNANPHAVTLKKGFKLAKVATLDSVASIIECKPIETIKPVMNVTKTELDQFHKSYGFHINPALSGDQKYEVLQLLYRYKSVFARDVTDIKQCKGPPLSLELHSDRAVCEQLRWGFSLHCVTDHLPYRLRSISYCAVQYDCDSVHLFL